MSELETRSNDDDVIDASVITKVQTETAVIKEVLRKEGIPEGEVGEEV